MAEALVNVLLERLSTLALDKVEEEFRLVVGVEKEVASLTSNLEAIQAVLEDAEQRQVTEASVRRWLSELTQVSLEMDDVLDEWITEVLRHQMEKREKHALGTKNKVFSSASSFISGSKLRRLSHRRKIAARIRELNGKIYLIAKQKQDFGFQNFIARVPQLPHRPKTTSLPNVKTFGRDIEKNLIISKLLGESSEENEVPLIIPIVGMGGMGKTSLANLVYNDDTIKSHFNKSIWVCVSDPFEEIKVAKAIVECLGKDSTSNELETLMKKMNESIVGQKFLIVLDDVWSPKLSQWEELIKPLRNGAMGSRVLVTTRKEEVAVLMKATTQMIRMKELGESFCLSLFYYNAGIVESSVSEEFSSIGLELVRRCKGLPLAAKSLGSLMQNKKTIHEWRTILNSKIWELKEIEQDVFQPLLLSYHDLSPTTKQCILYCAIFPKDYVYDMNTLIELWMSQDYLNVKESKDKIIVGQNIFDDLVMRSFFQDIEEGEIYRGIRCKIHDIVHDFLRYLTGNECLMLNVELDASETKEQPSDEIRHLTLVDGSDSLVDSFLRNCKKLRTLIMESDFKYSILIELIVELKCLRTITLSGEKWWSSLEEIPKTIGGLIHLRYLDLSYNVMKELPGAMGSLYNLQTLRLVNCKSLRKLDVGRLINLRHLYVDGCDSLWFIKGIEKLPHLQRLDVFSVTDEGNKLEHLKDLNQLQGSLEIRIGGNPNMAENTGFMLNKSHLLELKLEFSSPLEDFLIKKKSGDEAAQREMMNGLEPHPDLESLQIRRYAGVAFSDWLSSSLHRLTALSLEHCGNCKYMPPLGKLASLESLYIESLDGVSKVGVEFLGIIEQAAGQTSSSSSSSAFISFPKLKKLTFNGMWSWEEWEGVEEDNSDKKNNNITIMPCLSELTIDRCKKLKALPDFLWNTPLQELQINYSRRLENLYKE